MRKLIFVLCLFAFACEDKKDEPKKAPPSVMKVVSSTAMEYDSCAQMTVYHDEERKTTCYVVAGCDGRGAISCLKDDLATQK